jgi:ElaB/YqjD/DUF883 family membrane-anchored ribosome-binding protein
MSSNSEPRSGFSTENKAGVSSGSSRTSGSADYGRTENNKDNGSAANDFNALRSDLSALKDTVTDFISKAGNDISKAGSAAMTTAKETTSDVANQIGGTASDIASAASSQAKTFASELERMGRANPLGAIVGALLVGVMIGLLGRGGKS